MIRPAVLSIAGSDSGGGAGIQADLRTFSRLGTFGTTAITAVTAQNLAGVAEVLPVPPTIIEAQIEAVLRGFPVVAAKTGMLWSAEVVAVAARLLRAGQVRHFVVDPVMVATSGARLLREDAVEAYRELLLPGATLVTPNLDEAAVLLDVTSIALRDLEEAARALGRRCRCPVLLKGGHLEGDPVDLLVAEGTLQRWSRRRIDNVNTHGTGCMLSAAITAALSHGMSLAKACEQGLEFVAEALRHPWELANGTRLAGIEGVTTPEL
jgi:hydroxymethylpyrimidine/phosphomethylpyrimidine kinase